MRDPGYTLIELMIVVAIIGLLATLGTLALIPTEERAREDIALAKCREYHDAVTLWRLQGPTRRFPGSLKEMEVPLAEGEEVFARIVPDPWNRPFRLEIDGKRVRVWSDGPDATPGTDDDIAYIPPEDR